MKRYKRIVSLLEALMFLANLCLLLERGIYRKTPKLIQMIELARTLIHYWYSRQLNTNKCGAGLNTNAYNFPAIIRNSIQAANSYRLKNLRKPEQRKINITVDLEVSFFLMVFLYNIVNLDMLESKLTSRLTVGYTLLYIMPYKYSQKSLANQNTWKPLMYSWRPPLHAPCVCRIDWVSTIFSMACYKITELLRARSLVNNCVKMRVCKHDCDVLDSRVLLKTIL